MIAALFVQARSVYHKMSDVQAFDEKRDARSFAGGVPVVAHPPCRMWSRRTRHQAKGSLCEMALGLWAVQVVLREGGILEQPAGSCLFRHLPPGGKVIHLDQSWFGFGTIKPTWLWCVRCEPRGMPFFLYGGDSHRSWQLMSRQQRSATNPVFARWLVDTAHQAA